MGLISKSFFFGLWVFAALLILPCVFVANHLYPLWADWGDNF